MELQQIKTDSTIDVADAVEEMQTENRAARTTVDGETVFVRAASDNDHRDGFLVEAPVPAIEDRREFVVDDGETVRELLRDAEAAVLISINDSPWSPLYDDTS